MSDGKYPIIAREGWSHLILAFGIALFAQTFVGGILAFLCWIGFLFVLQFFRDPARAIPSNPAAVICPADGKVIALDECNDPYLNRPAKRISIFMNVFDVHSNRIPVRGQVMEQWYHPGSFLNAALDKASAENERNAIWIKTDDGHDVVVVQVAGLIARRILSYINKDDRVLPGQRFGFIRFGSRVDLYLPKEFLLKTTLGARVKSGADIVASLPPQGE